MSQCRYPLKATLTHSARLTLTGLNFSGLFRSGTYLDHSLTLLQIQPFVFAGLWLLTGNESLDDLNDLCNLVLAFPVLCGFNLNLNQCKIRLLQAFGEIYLQFRFPVFL